MWSIGCDDDRSYVMRAFGPWRPGDSLADEYRVLLHLQEPESQSRFPSPPTTRCCASKTATPAMYSRRGEVAARPEKQEHFGSAFLSFVGRYVAGYHAANPLSDAERAAVPAAILAADICIEVDHAIAVTKSNPRRPRTTGTT